MEPKLSSGIFLRDITYEVNTDNRYGYPGGWDAQMQALANAKVGPVDIWKMHRNRKNSTIASRKMFNYMMSTYSDPPVKVMPNRKKLRSTVHKKK